MNRKYTIYKGIYKTNYIDLWTCLYNQAIRYINFIIERHRQSMYGAFAMLFGLLYFFQTYWFVCLSLR